MATHWVGGPMGQGKGEGRGACHPAAQRLYQRCGCRLLPPLLCNHLTELCRVHGSVCGGLRLPLCTSDLVRLCLWLCAASVPHCLPHCLPLCASVCGCAWLQVALQRQMDRGTREFADFRRQRDTELLQLKKQGRLNAAQLQKLEALHSKQQAVLRRKTGEWGGWAWVGGWLIGGGEWVAWRLLWMCLWQLLLGKGRLHRLSNMLPAPSSTPQPPPCTSPTLCSSSETLSPPPSLSPSTSHPAEEAEAARKRLKQLEERQRQALRPGTSAAANSVPPSERPFTAPPAAGGATLNGPARRNPANGSAGTGPAVTPFNPAGASPEAECQPNPNAPLLRDERTRRDWVEGELDAYCSSFELQARCCCATAATTMLLPTCCCCCLLLGEQLVHCTLWCRPCGIRP